MERGLRVFDTVLPTNDNKRRQFKPLLNNTSFSIYDMIQIMIYVLVPLVSSLCTSLEICIPERDLWAIIGMVKTVTGSTSDSR